MLMLTTTQNAQPDYVALAMVLVLAVIVMVMVIRKRLSGKPQEAADEDQQRCSPVPGVVLQGLQETDKGSR